MSNATRVVDVQGGLGTEGDPIVRLQQAFVEVFFILTLGYVLGYTHVLDAEVVYCQNFILQLRIRILLSALH